MSATLSAGASTTSTAHAATSSAASGTISVSGNLKVVGIILAVSSGLLIGSSFVFKKKGLLRSQQGLVAGEGVAYLKSPLWWIGMTMMILGELCNFAAYAFVEAIVVTPMGALSVVICAILSSLFLNEKLSFFGWLGCGLCILGSVIIALNGPQESSVGQITEFQKLFLAPGFLVYGSILIAAALVIIFWFAPRYGKKSMLWYIMVCSMIGGISVSVTTGLGSAIVTTAMGDNQFKHWFIYFLMVFVAVTLITEVYYLNVALALFNTAMVTPTYYVIFTFFSMVTTIVLFQGLKAQPTQIVTLVMGFLVICVGITILQLSKIDPTQIKTLDRRSTLLLQAAKSNTEGIDEKSLAAVEDPGMDALRGSFGTMGSIIRARSARRMSMSSRATGSIHSRYSTQQPVPPLPGHRTDPLAGVKRHQLFDNPMPSTPEAYAGEGNSERISMASRPSVLGSPFSQRKQTIKFGDQDVVHSYHVPGSGDDTATHERRNALHGSGGSVKYASVSSAAWSSDAVVGANGEQYDGKAVDNDGQVLTLTLPVIESQEDVSNVATPLTAPAALGGLRDVYHHPPVSNPYDGLPSTSTLSSFPSNNSSSPSYGERERQRSPAGSHNMSPASRLRLFGRHSHNNQGPSRHYPRGSRDEDQEESVSLWHRRSNESSDADLEASGESENGGVGIGGDEDHQGLPGGGIRLVPSSTSSKQHQTDFL
ncbi:magnesium transporter NIPA-domain-containing protein [Cubamyces lactineus]|nr:magnesium transporter NIPA-domain-containing protein [Cubamyces lactineus]